MKYIKYLVIVILLLIPLNVFAENKVFANSYSFGYYDQKLGHVKNATFEVQNISGEKVLDIKADESGEYIFPFNYYTIYEEVKDSEIFLIFDEEHREIIKELLSDDKYLNEDTFNEFVSNVEKDEIIQYINEASPGMNGWGIFGHTPIRIVEKNTDYPIYLYINVYFEVVMNLNSFDFVLSFQGVPYYLDKTDDIREVHKDRYKEYLETGNYVYVGEESSDFKENYLQVKRYQSYSNNCLPRELESALQGIEDCDMLTLYKNILEETIMLDDKIDLISYFNNRFNSDSISIMDVEDKSILKIENNVIVPLKIGSTRIKMNVDNDIYYFKVNIKDLKSNSSIPNNPNTGIISTILSLLVIIAAVVILANKNLVIRRKYDRN